MTDQLGIQGDVRPEDEPLPFLSNFQDIFLSIGLIIFLVGISILAVTIGESLITNSDTAPWVIAGLCGAVLAIVWVLSEVIVRKRRRILPGIILCVTFMWLIQAIGMNIYAGTFGERIEDDFDSIEWVDPDIDDSQVTHEALRKVAASARDTLPWSAKGFFLAMPVLMLAGAFIYYRRFQLPFSSAMVGLSTISVAFTFLLFAFPYDILRFLPLIGFLSGLAMLIGGIHFDMRDPERVTRWSGNGFWLHFFAAPMLLSSVLFISYFGISFSVPDMVAGDFEFWEKNPFTVQQSIVTLTIIGIFAVISLLLNRRALVVSGLVSAGIAIWIIVDATGLGGAQVAALTLILLGGGILFLGLGWNGARKVLLALVPSSGVWGRIFPRVDNVDG
ncbi:hypothetical protein [Parvularcula marina]|uniref:hypothetical protein n=1 Tax=Parvularcula marina TaxID=2292771 RepID=UPI0035165240